MRFKIHSGSYRNLKFRILCIALFLFARTDAQFYQFKNYNVKDGLPSSEVYDVLQDASGYLWFGTDMGISRFNGYEFKNFNTADGLADNTNFGLTEDSKGRIWCRSFSGRISYCENEKIKTTPCNSALKEILGRTLISSLYVDEGDTIWGGLNNTKVLKISPPWKTENVRLLDLKTPGAYLILFSESNFIYGGSSPLVCDLTVYNNSLKKLYAIPVHATQDRKVHIRFSYTLLGDHSYTITANNVVARFNEHGLLSRKENSAILVSIFDLGNSNLLAGTFEGVKQFSDYAFTEAGMFPLLDKKVITDICRDHENGIWFCTEGSGVFYLPFLNFRYYSPADGLSESKISCVAKAGNKVICGHLDGSLSILQQQKLQAFRLSTASSIVSGANRVTGMAFNGKDKLFIGTISNIFTLNLETLSAETNHLKGSKAIIRASDSTLWSLQFNNLVQFLPDQPFKLLSDVPLNVYSDNVYEDHTGKLWICPIHSIWSWSAKAGLVDEGKNVPLLDARIVDVQEDHEGNTWMVSRGNGVIIKRGNHFFNIAQKDGLAGNMCRTIFVDSGNVVWVGTNNGLSKIQVIPGNEFHYTITSYSSKNGLLTNEVNDILRFENKLWLIHNNGVSVFDPENIRNNTSPPPVYISGLMVNDDSVSTASALSFSYNQNYFNIGFIGLSYKDAGKLEYRYKMEGIDSNWIYTSYTSVKYQTLPPGSYRFVVFAKNNDGYWSAKPALLSFTILPAWWQTWYFNLISVFVLLVLLFFIFRIRINNVRKRDRKKALLHNRIAAIELNALRAQMNPHFVFNSINSVQYFITNNDPDSSQLYLSKFAKLIRYVVDNSKLTTISVQKEIEALKLYLDLETLRFGKHFEYHIHVDPGVDVEFTQIPSMLIQPYVENSIWHGIMHKEGTGKIEVTLKMKEHVLCCIVEDNGIGRKKSMELKQEKESTLHSSVGMSNTRERLEIINQVNKSSMSVVVSDVLDENGETCGTKVIIYIPIS
jgi:ligand-binding sensor domain-containing protein